MPAPEIIHQLVQLFEQNKSSYRSGAYNETQLRREFLDPFFEALGWDVFNNNRYAEAYKDVIHEDSIKVGGATQAPDYAFRIGGTRKFFVEAKKPAVNVKEDISPAYQLRRYAWSSKLPLSILTDFEELAVYDCRGKPDKTDKASTGRIMYFNYQDYIPRWDEISAVFSREAVLRGSFDKYAEAARGKHGTAEVDHAFLAEIERWRDLLAHNIALRNPQLSQRELNYAVQMTIDRIIFLRICEDRGIEFYGELMALLNGGEVYARMGQLFQKADQRYNSGLFHFHPEKGEAGAPDQLTLGLHIDDRPLKDILSNLYYPDSPYEFSVLPADILGQVYEQFLGKVIRLTEGHHAVIDDKPEVKKAGGVYYTPTYIVEYIVRHTLGRLLEGKKPGERGVGKGEPLRVLDPACGSGSFLIGAYQYLLDWYRDGFVTDGPEKWAKGRAPALYQSAGGEYKLTTAERKRILLDHIYGVDIDPQAVEVTKLSLLLKVLEGESEQSLARQLSFFQERALPDLGQNVKCGNSLIGPDFYAQTAQQMSLLDDEEQYRINAFDWQREFKGVFLGSGGFDAVIGNPPYIRMETFKELKTYLKTNYLSHDERSDLYAYFIEKAHKLLNQHGQFGMIVSNKFLRANYGKPLRDFLQQNAAIDRIVDFAGLPVFRGATVRTIILLTSRNIENSKLTLYSPPLAIDKFESVEKGSLLIDDAVSETSYPVSITVFNQSGWSFAKQQSENFLRRIKSQFTPLKEYCNGQIFMGIKSGLTEAFVIDDQQRKSILDNNPRAIDLIKPFVNGRDIRRYFIEPKDNYLIFTHHGVSLTAYPGIEKHLQPFKDRLKRRATKQEWYELQQPQYNFKTYFDGIKIIFPDIATAPRFALDEIGFYGSNTIYFIPKHDLYLLGLLNSKLAFFYFKSVCAGLEGKTEIYLQFFGQYLEGFPVSVNPVDSPESHKQNIIIMVERMLDLHKRLAAARAPSEKTLLQRQIETSDAQIDALVYQLYGLSQEEIRLVEEAGL